MAANRPTEEFIKNYLQYSEIVENLRLARVNAITSLGYNNAYAVKYLEKVSTGESASRGLEESDKTNELEESIHDFFESHPGFFKELVKWRNVIGEQVRQTNPELRGYAYIKAVRNAAKNFFKLNGPTAQNRTHKAGFLAHLKVMPPMGVYHGGTNYHSGLAHFYGTGGKRSKRTTRRK